MRGPQDFGPFSSCAKIRRRVGSDIAPAVWSNNLEIYSTIVLDRCMTLRRNLQVDDVTITRVLEKLIDNFRTVGRISQNHSGAVAVHPE